MKVAFFNTKPYDRLFFGEANEKFKHNITFFEAHLNRDTCKLAFGFEAVCAFVNDQLDKETLDLLANNGVRLIALRCAGFNNVDLHAAAALKLTVVRVPAYAPHGVAEHAIALMLDLNRKIHRAHVRIHDGNFSLDGLLGFEIYKRTIGIIGTGKIGAIVARIMSGFGTKVLAYDPVKNNDCLTMGVEYVSLEELYQKSDIITLHLPLTKETRHMINEQSIAQMKSNVMLINTSRGGLIDTCSVIEGLKFGQIGFLGLDVYEEEGDMFFEDLSGHIIQDDVFARLLTFPNVVITGRNAFFS
jgi:D-lactate dehydrogenase